MVLWAGYSEDDDDDNTAYNGFLSGIYWVW